MTNIQLSEVNKRISLHEKMTSKDSEFLIQLVAIEPNNLDAWLTLIYLAWVNKFPVLNKWEKYYLKVVNLEDNKWSPSDYLSIHSLAHELYGYDENYDGERITAQAMYDIEPQNWICMAQLAEMSGDKEKSLELAKNIYDAYSNNGKILLRLGNIYKKLSFRYNRNVLLKKSIDMYEQAIKYLDDDKEIEQAMKIINKLTKDYGNL